MNHLFNDYEILTSLLHLKSNSNVITFSDLEIIFKEYLDVSIIPLGFNMNDIVIDEIINLSLTITPIDCELEHKILLAMAIRQIAEKNMINEIGKSKHLFSSEGTTSKLTSFDIINALDSNRNQTRYLSNYYKHINPHSYSTESSLHNK